MSQTLSVHELSAEKDELLARVIEAVDDPEVTTGIILYGSRARAEDGAASDIDLIMVQRYGPMVEHSCTVLGAELDVCRGTLADLRQRLKREDPLNNNFLLNALHEGIIYRDRTGCARALAADAEIMWAQGPAAASPAEVAATRKGLQRMLLAATRLTRKAPASREAALIAEMRCHQVLIQSVYLYYRVRRRWTAGFPQMLERLKAEGSPLYDYWEQYVEAGALKQRLSMVTMFVEAVYE